MVWMSANVNTTKDSPQLRRKCHQSQTDYEVCAEALGQTDYTLYALDVSFRSETRPD